MFVSKIIYENLCETRKSKPLNPTQDIHRHHIVPKHCGGTDDENNITYLTIREHIIAHYLLWRINKNPNDLRSYYMLGGKLTIFMRKEIGKFCFEKKIGMFAPKYGKCKKEWVLKGIQKQMEQKIGIFDPKLFSYHASIGGKAGYKNNPTLQYWNSKEGIKKRASLGAKAHKGKRAMYDPKSNNKIFHRVPPEKWDDFLKRGFIFGSPIKVNLGKKFISQNKRKVTDGVTVYESVSEAAKVHGVTSGAIIYRIKSKKTNWKYFSDI